MRAESISELIAATRHEAERAEFPVDEPVYRRAGRDPSEPILFAGSLDSPVGFVGRDLGKDEVAAGQPLIGAAGRLVRLGILAAHGVEAGRDSNPQSGPPLQQALDYSILTNTVPYKPPGNKAYAPAVRRRFRPFVERLLADHWRGYHVITLGTEAFQWFEPYIDPEEFAERGTSEAPLSVLVRMPAPMPSLSRGGRQEAHRLPAATSVAAKPAMVRPVPVDAGRAIGRSP